MYSKSLSAGLGRTRAGERVSGWRTDGRADGWASGRAGGQVIEMMTHLVFIVSTLRDSPCLHLTDGRTAARNNSSLVNSLVSNDDHPLARIYRSFAYTDGFTGFHCFTRPYTSNYTLYYVLAGLNDEWLYRLRIPCW